MTMTRILSTYLFVYLYLYLFYVCQSIMMPVGSDSLKEVVMTKVSSLILSTHSNLQTRVLVLSQPHLSLFCHVLPCYQWQ